MSWSKLNEFVLPLGIIGCLLVFLVPLPGKMMDVLLAGNIAIALVVLLTTLFVRTPLEFSVFPTVLLATTLARLVLNVATTRLILTKADSVGVTAAGEVVRQFGQYVSGDRLVVGFVIFAIIFVIQMLVITKGATRISEVAARFTLDGIPGRQLAIDADLNAGVIDQEEAQHRREQLTRQADFFGAMDGASKFVRGDAIAGVIITLINIVGGLFIGLTHGSLGILETTELYTKLTIGDGLVSQIPALLISLSAGLLVTRGTEKTNLPVEFLRQLFTQPQVMAIAGGFLLLLVFTNLPGLPLTILAVGFFGLAYWNQSNGETHSAVATTTKKATPRRATPTQKATRNSEAEKSPRLEDFLKVDPLELELGRGLLGIANAAKGGDLMTRIKSLRERVAVEIGLILPSVRVRDNLSLADSHYAIKLAGNVVATGAISTEGVVVIPPPGMKSRSLPGAVAFAHPAIEKRARLVPLDRVSDAKAAGCQIISTSDLITRHLSAVVRGYSHELLTRDATRKLIDEVKRTSPTVVDELIPDVLKLSEVQQVLQRLLREGVPIRQLPSILEALGDHAHLTKDQAQLTEFVRKRLARTISAQYRDRSGTLNVVTLDPELEDQLSVAANEQLDVLTSTEKSNFQTILQRTLDRLRNEDHPPVLLTKSDIRLAVLKLARAVVPNVIVLGQDEVAQGSQIRSVGIVGLV